jgi:hypothetical protein
MAVTTRDSTPAGIAVRVHMLEEVVDKLVPSEGQDLTAIINGLNRLYNMTLLGSQYSSANSAGVTYEEPGFAFDDSEYTPPGYKTASIVTATYGNFLDRALDRPFYDAVFAGSKKEEYELGQKSLHETLFGTEGYTGNGSQRASRGLLSLRARAHTLMEDLGVKLNFSDDGLYDKILTAHGSIVGAIYGDENSYDPDGPEGQKSLLELLREMIAALTAAIANVDANVTDVYNRQITQEATISDLIDRVSWLETNS